MNYDEQRPIYAQNISDQERQNEIAVHQHVMQEPSRVLFGFEGTVLAIAPHSNHNSSAIQHVIQPHDLNQLPSNVPQHSVIQHHESQVIRINQGSTIDQLTGDQLALTQTQNSQRQSIATDFWCSLCNQQIGHNEEAISLGHNTTSFSRTKLSDLINKFVSESPKTVGNGAICRACHNLLEQADSLDVELTRTKNQIQRLVEDSHFFRHETEALREQTELKQQSKEKLEESWEEPIDMALSDDSNDPDVTLANLRGSKKRLRKSVKRPTKLDIQQGDASDGRAQRNRARPRAKKKQIEDDSTEEGTTKICPSCEKVVPLSKFMLHLSTHKMFACPFCSEVYKKKEITIHMAERHQSEPTFPCRDCDSSFNTFSQLSQHYSTLHFGQDAERFSCKICSKSFASSSGLKVHVQAVHSKSQLHECPVCKETFTQKGNMKSHVRRLHQTDTKKLSCNTCSKRFLCPSDLRKHVDRAHLKVHSNKVTCEICSKTFSDLRAMKVHVNAVHTKSIQYPCPDCKMIFHSSTNMTTHRRRMHSGIEGRSHICQLCNKGFCSPSDLRTHMKVVHENLRKFICDICGQSFKVASHLKYHRRRHTGETPFKCPHCSKSFHGPSHIADHVKKVHKTVYIGANQRRRLNLPDDAPPPPPGILPSKDQKVKNILMQNLEPIPPQLNQQPVPMQHANLMPVQQSHMVSSMEPQGLLQNGYTNSIHIEHNQQQSVPMVVRLFSDGSY